MPLSRMSLRTATKLACDAVTLVRLSGEYVVRRHDGTQVHRSKPMCLPDARRRLRVDRIFVALMKLGVESTEALPAALAAAHTDRVWTSVVGDVMERRAISVPSCRYPLCDCRSVAVDPFVCSKGFVVS